MSEYRLIPLHGKYGDGCFAKVDAEVYGRLSPLKWRASKEGYALRHKKVNGKSTPLLMHHLVLEPKEGFITDHVNGDRLDNRKENLRYATNAENLRNRRKYFVGVSRFKGVGFDDRRPKKWRAKIQVNGKVIRLGSYYTEVEAAKAYNAGALLHHGEFASLNDI